MIPKAVHDSTHGSLGAVGNGSDPDSDPFSHGSIHARLIEVHSVIFSPISGNSRYFSGHSKAERIANFLVFAVFLHNQYRI